MKNDPEANSIPLHQSVWSTLWVPSPWLRAGGRLDKTREAHGQIRGKQWGLRGSLKSRGKSGSIIQGRPGQGELPGEGSREHIRPRLGSLGQRSQSQTPRYHPFLISTATEPSWVQFIHVYLPLLSHIFLSLLAGKARILHLAPCSPFFCFDLSWTIPQPVVPGFQHLPNMQSGVKSPGLS